MPNGRIAQSKHGSVSNMVFESQKKGGHVAAAYSSKLLPFRHAFNAAGRASAFSHGINEEGYVAGSGLDTASSKAVLVPAADSYGPTATQPEQTQAKSTDYSMHRNVASLGANTSQPNPLAPIAPAEASAPDPRPSWASIVHKNTIPNFQLNYIKPTNPSQRHIVKVPKTIVAEGCRKWEHTLMGYFIGRKLPYSLVKTATSRMWTKLGLVDMLATETGYFFFKFANKDSCEGVLEGGPWHIAGQPILLRKWEPGLELTKESPTAVPVWVHIHNIPLEYWNADSLSYIASAIGKPLHVDRVTATGRRISFAWMCIEINAEDELLKSLELGSDDTQFGEPERVTLRVEYQWIPIRCARCKKFGHNCDRKRTPPTVSNQPPNVKDLEANGTWMKQGKGKTIVADVEKLPASSSEHAAIEESLNVIPIITPMVLAGERESELVHHPTLKIPLQKNRFSILDFADQLEGEGNLVPDLPTQVINVVANSEEYQQPEATILPFDQPPAIAIDVAVAPLKDIPDIEVMNGDSNLNRGRSDDCSRTTLGPQDHLTLTQSPIAISDGHVEPNPTTLPRAPPVLNGEFQQERKECPSGNSPS